MTAFQIIAQEDICTSAKKIILRDGEAITDKDGDCTRLYWHLNECEICRNLREKLRDKII